MELATAVDENATVVGVPGGAQTRKTGKMGETNLSYEEASFESLDSDGKKKSQAAGPNQIYGGRNVETVRKEVESVLIDIFADILDSEWGDNEKA